MQRVTTGRTAVHGLRAPAAARLISRQSDSCCSYPAWLCRRFYFSLLLSALGVFWLHGTIIIFEDPDLLSTTLAAQQLNQVQQPKTAQNKIDKYSKLASTHTHLLPICYRDSWFMAWDGHWAHTRDWQAYHHYHRRHPGDNIPFQRLSMALQRGNAVSFHNTMVTE